MCCVRGSRRKASVGDGARATTVLTLCSVVEILTVAGEVEDEVARRSVSRCLIELSRSASAAVNANDTSGVDAAAVAVTRAWKGIDLPGVQKCVKLWVEKVVVEGRSVVAVSRRR